MKKLFYLLVACSALLWSCSKDDDNENGKITLTVKPNETVWLGIYSYNEKDEIIIDWGDNEKEEKAYTVAEYGESEFYGYGIELSHEYKTSNTRTITIKGNIKEFYCEDGVVSLDASECKGLTYLDCSYGEITSLDVKGCKALTYLDCSENTLTSLDVSGCKALTTLDCEGNNIASLNVKGCKELIAVDCSYNKLSAKELDQIFNDLPDGKDNGTGKSTIYIYRNPGSDACDKEMIKKKGWRVED